MENVASWGEVEAEAPSLAERVRGRFEAHGLGFLATLRRDGRPRISGLEPLFSDGELWLGMMPGSRKGADLRRDARFALHAASVDRAVRHGDAKVAGRAVAVRDEARKAAFVTAFAAATGQPPPPGPMELFRADLEEVTLLRPAGDHLVIETWRAGHGVSRVERA